MTDESTPNPLTQFIDDVDEVLDENRPEIQREIDEFQRDFNRELDRPR